MFKGCCDHTQCYNNQGHDVLDDTICVMEKYDSRSAEEFYESVYAGDTDPFCASCHEKMLENTANISIQGN